MFITSCMRTHQEMMRPSNKSDDILLFFFLQSILCGIADHTGLQAFVALQSPHPLMLFSLQRLKILHRRGMDPA